MKLQYLTGFGAIMFVFATTSYAETITCNANGYVIVPDNPYDTVYLGKTCDAYNEQLGSGIWCWRDDTVFVRFARGESSTKRDLPNCRALGGDGKPCNCRTDPLPR